MVGRVRIFLYIMRLATSMILRQSSEGAKSISAQAPACARTPFARQLSRPQQAVGRWSPQARA